MKKSQFITIITSVILSVLITSAVMYIGNVNARPLLASGSPTVVSYQGQVSQSGSPYNGTGYFKFAVVDGSGGTTYWSNDGTSSGGSEPTAAVQLSVNDGLFNVLLGDTNLSNMTSLPASVFDGTDRHLRVWFSSDGSSFTQLSPDRRVASVPYALQAEEAADADTLDGVDSSDLYTKSEVDALLAAHDARINDLETVLGSVDLENGGADFVFEGVNVHIRDGSGDTDGSVNGKGNLIIGYNEDRLDDATRTGSHNLVVGPEHSYSSYGGFVAGSRNEVSGQYASVSGGQNNTASGQYASVSGGGDNTASGYSSSISGGYSNTASEESSSVNGGRNNIASGRFASVLGGGGFSSDHGNHAWADYSIVAGGRSNVAGEDSGSDRTVGEASAVLAGENNKTGEDIASVSGGQNNIASDLYASVSGGDGNTASGFSSSISGGTDNEASGGYSTIGGGNSRNVSGIYDWQAGTLFETQ